MTTLGADFAFVDVLKRWALSLDSKTIDWVFGGGLIEKSDLALVTTDTSGEKPKMSAKSIIKKVFLLLGHFGLVCKAIGCLARSLKAKSIAKKIPAEYDEKKLAKWTKNTTNSLKTKAHTKSHFSKTTMYKIARVGLHHFEEPCLSGERGSGTIFFSGCNLRCLFCQNFEISHGGKGLEVSEKQLVSLMLYLQDSGAHNINLVTPSNYTNLLKDTLKIAKSQLKIPIVWNSSGYETVQNLKKLDGLVDIYLPDFKYSDDDLAWQYSHAKGIEKSLSTQ